MDKDKKIQENATLEELFVQLEDAIRKMEKEDISLEDSFSLYHKGMDMLKLCNEKIDKVEKKMLVLDEEGDAHEPADPPIHGSHRDDSYILPGP